MVLVLITVLASLQESTFQDAALKSINMGSYGENGLAIFHYTFSEGGLLLELL